MGGYQVVSSGYQVVGSGYLAWIISSSSGKLSCEDLASMHATNTTLGQLGLSTAMHFGAYLFLANGDDICMCYYIKHT